MPDISQFGFLAILATVAAFWRQAVSFVNRIRSFFITQTTLEGGVTDAVLTYCWQHFRRTPFGDRYYISGSRHIRPLNRIQEVAWERPPTQPLVFFDGWRPIMIGATADNNTNAPRDHTLKVTTIRKLVDVEKLVINALEYYNQCLTTSQNHSTRFFIRRIHGRGRSHYDRGMGDAPYGGTREAEEKNKLQRYLKWSTEEIGPPLSKSPMETIAIPPSVADAVEEFRRWKRSEQWFRERGIPWRRGWLIHGKPGTGKTTLVRAIAQLEDMPVFSFDLTSLSNEELVTHWKQMQENTPCIALLEDIDGAFDHRTNVAGEKGGGLTFDCLLQCLSGIETADGVFVIVTTNHIEKVDPALGVATSESSELSTRPGRLDRVIEMPVLDRPQREAIANRILNTWPELIPEILEKGRGLTGAQFTEICVKEALKRYWGSAASDSGL